MTRNLGHILGTLSFWIFWRHLQYALEFSTQGSHLAGLCDPIASYFPLDPGQLIIPRLLHLSSTFSLASGLLFSSNFSKV
ncbi:hypothetical protein K438DRAFT_1817517, partial [Mycena galopus ATCC 62051]